MTQVASTVRKTEVAMDYTHYTDAIPGGLLSAIAENCCVALLGAGVTRRCLSKKRVPLPNWPVLLRDLASWASERNALAPEEVQSILELIDKSEFLMVAQEMREKLGDESLSRFVAEVFDPDAIVATRAHELLSVVPFRGFITTNYDNLLERAYVRVNNRHIERVLATDRDRVRHLLDSTPFLLKLHGDLHVPSSIVLAHRDYLRLIVDVEYQRLLDGFFSSFSLLMVGYGLADLDVVLSLDRLAHAGISRQHYLLCKRGTRNEVERRRLLHDRNIQVIEYVDYFGFHNHVDTFLKAILKELGKESQLQRVRGEIRRRIQVHYPAARTVDGKFVWNYIFREGAITLSAGAQQEHLKYLREALDDSLKTVDHLVFIIDPKALEDTDFVALIDRSLRVANSAGVQVIFMVVGVQEKPEYVRCSAAASPVFYLREGFGESDLAAFREYIAQQVPDSLRHLI